jgi:Fe-S oxidoreductase
MIVRDLLGRDLDSRELEGCINCGLCMSRCPALRALSQATEFYAGPRDIATSLSRMDPDAWATSDTIYYCTMCGACQAVCPMGIAVPDLVAHIRGQILAQQGEEANRAHRGMQKSLETAGNIYGQPIGGVGLEYRKARAEWVLFAGCVYTYTEPDSLLSTMRLLAKLGVDFTTIEEKCCGGPSGVIGVPLVKSLAEHNLAQIEAAHTRRVITACPRCYLTFSHDPAYAGLEVVYTTKLLAQLGVEAKTEHKITYHDPCELGRLRGEYASARHLMRGLTDRFVEIPYCGDLSDCCGAGGGVRGAFTRLSLQIARRRLLEAQAIGADILLTECPSCLHNLRNARRRQDVVEIYNLSEYLGLLV